MPDNEFGYGTVAPAVSAKGNLLNPSAPIASVAMPKVIAPVAPPANAAPSSVQMPNVPQPQISQQQIQQMGDNTTGAVSNMVGNAMPGIIGTGAALLAGYGLSKIPSMLGKGKEEGKAPPESKQGIPAEVEKTQKVEEPKKENKYHLEQDHKELTKEELNKANEVFNTLDNIKTEPTTPKPETPAQQTIKTELKPVETNNPTFPIATTEPNPVVSGEGTSPLHNPAGQGLTQVEATSASATPNAAFPAETNTTKESGNLTNPAENPTQGGVEQVKKEVKGAVVPRRSKQETQIANEEMRFNKYYNQVANRLAGTENLKEHPHITEQFDKAWEDVFHNVLGGKMEKSQGGAPAKIHEIEAHINANPEKYPDLVKYMSEAKQYAKGNINPKEGGFSHIGAMLGMLGAGGLGAYMVNRYGNPFQESMKKANEAMGEATGTQDLGKANKAEELSPAMRAIFTKASNPVYRKEINQQLATEKNPERIKELKRELEKAK